MDSCPLCITPGCCPCCCPCAAAGGGGGVVLLMLPVLLQTAGNIVIAMECMAGPVPHIHVPGGILTVRILAVSSLSKSNPRC